MLLGLGRAADAEKALAPALAGHANPELERLAAAARLARGDTGGALLVLDRLLATNLHDSRARLLRARARLRSGDAAGAVDDADAASRELDPKVEHRAREDGRDAGWLEARSVAVDARIALGRTDEALTLAEELARARPDEPTALLALTAALGARGDDFQSVRVLDGALAGKRAEDSRLLAARGEAHAALLDDAAARADLEAAAEHAPSPRRAAELLVELASIADAARDPAGAVADLENASKAAGDDPAARAFVSVARARREVLVARNAVFAQEELASAAKEGEEIAGTALVKALVALELKDSSAALDAAVRARAEDGRDPLAASVELEARKLKGDAPASTKLARELAQLEGRATDVAGRLERRAAISVQAASFAPDAKLARVEWDAASKQALRSCGLGPQRPGALALAAAAASHLDGAQEAKRLLARACELGSEHPLVALWDGRARLAAEDGEGAARALARAIALSPDELGTDRVVQAQLAKARALAKDWPGVEEAAKRLLELDPDSADAVSLLADAARARGDKARFDEYATRLKEKTSEGPQRAAELDRKAFDLLLRHKPTDALPMFEQAAQLAPGVGRLWKHLAMARTDAGIQMGSFVAFMRLLEIEPYVDRSDAEEFVHMQAGHLGMVVNIDDFVAQVEELVAAEPRAAHLHFLAAYCEWGRGEFFKNKSTGWMDRALAHLDKALWLDPRFAVAYAYRGHVRRLRGMLGPAREDLDRAITLGRGRMPVAHLFRASLMASIGENESAQRDLETMLEESLSDRGRILEDPALVKLLQERPTLRARIEKLPAEPRAQGFTEGY